MEKPSPAYRAELYKVIERIAGRKLNNDEHDELKKMIMDYIREKGKAIYMGHLCQQKDTNTVAFMPVNRKSKKLQEQIASPMRIWNIDV